MDNWKKIKWEDIFKSPNDYVTKHYVKQFISVFYWLLLCIDCRLCNLMWSNVNIEMNNWTFIEKSFYSIEYWRCPLTLFGENVTHTFLIFLCNHVNNRKSNNSKSWIKDPWMPNATYITLSKIRIESLAQINAKSRDMSIVPFISGVVAKLSVWRELLRIIIEVFIAT